MKNKNLTKKQIYSLRAYEKRRERLKTDPAYKEKVKGYKKKWALKNKEKVKGYKKKWALKNKERLKRETKSKLKELAVGLFKTKKRELSQRKDKTAHFSNHYNDNVLKNGKFGENATISPSGLTAVLPWPEYERGYQKGYRSGYKKALGLGFWGKLLLTFKKL